MSRIFQHSLTLADGSRWVVSGENEGASIVSQLADAMQMHVMSLSDSLLPPSRLFVMVDANKPEASWHAALPSKDNGEIVYNLHPHNAGDGLFVCLMRLSLILVSETQARGGVLIHGALAEREGAGIVLAAPGGTGKTTASSRLPAPWRSLSDDATLVTLDSRGNYWAHPWPTWSRFLPGGPGGSWDVQNAVPLKGIFFLTRAIEDLVEPIGAGRAVCMLMESALQASLLMTRGLSNEEKRAVHLTRFNNICNLARIVPAHLLHISLTGFFWQDIVEALEGSFCENLRKQSYLRTKS